MKVSTKFLMVSMATFVALTSNAMAITVRGLSDTNEIVREQDRKTRKFERVYNRLDRMDHQNKNGNVRFDRNVRKLKRTEAEIRVLGNQRANHVDHYNIPEFAEGTRPTARVIRESYDSRGSRDAHVSYDSRDSDYLRDRETTYSRSERSDISTREDVTAAATFTTGNATFLLSDYQALLDCEKEKCKEASGPCTEEVPTIQAPTIVIQPAPAPLPVVIAPVPAKRDFKPAPTKRGEPVRVKEPVPEVCTVKEECPPPVVVEAPPAVVVVIAPEPATCEVSTGEVICPEAPVTEEAKAETAFVKSRYKNREKAKSGWIMTNTGIKRMKKQKLFVKVRLKGEMDPNEAARIMNAAQSIQLNDSKEKGTMADSLGTSPTSGTLRSTSGSGSAN